MHLAHLRAAGLSLWLAGGGAITVQQPAVELFRIAQHVLRGGASLGLVVELRDLRASTAAPSTPEDDSLSLERLASTPSDWEVSSGAVPRVAGRVRPREIDEVLMTPVRVAHGTLTAGRAIFIVPRVAVIGTLTGVAGGGIPSEACRLDRHIQLDDRTRPLAEFLDAVVAQAPGLAWVLTWEAAAPRETISLGVMCPDGSMSLLGMSLSR